MHDGRRLFEQRAKHRERNVGPRCDLLGQNAVILGTLDEVGEALLRNARTAIFGDAARDLAIAAADKHIGHRLTQRTPLGNGAQVFLSLGVCDVDQIGFGEPRRELQDRLGDRDVVVVGERAQNIDRRVGQRSKMPRKLGARLALDLFDEQREYVVEKIDMRIVVVAGAVEKERGHALQDFAALRARAALNDVFQFRDQREGVTHVDNQESLSLLACF